MSKETEVDLKDVELNEVDQEKQPMTDGEAGNNHAISPVTEKNGIVKIKIPDEESKFTGLSKEELMKVAGTPGWVKVRWALLILFWLGWLGMLAGAIAIIVQAPRCKPLPEMNWWNKGPLYQIGDVKAFASDLEGLSKKMEKLDELKVKSLIIGPIHGGSSTEKTEDLKLTEVSTESGSLKGLNDVIQAAHKRGMSVVLDLTPNYKGDPWLSTEALNNVVEQVKSALIYWLKEGLDGFLFYGVETVSSEAPDGWKDIQAIIRNNTKDEKKKVLIGVTNRSSSDEIAAVLNRTGVDLLLSGALRSQSPLAIAQTVEQLYNTHNQTQLAWNIGERNVGHLASIVHDLSVKLNQLLLLTLPGTPVFNYGDEIGLTDNTNNSANNWDVPGDEETSAELKRSSSFRKFFKAVSEERTKQRALLHGDYVPLFNSTNALAYVRIWDQNERFLVALNWHEMETVTLQLKHASIPDQAFVVLNTTDGSSPGDVVDLAELKLGPKQGVMLKFPYTA